MGAVILAISDNIDDIYAVTRDDLDLLHEERNSLRERERAVDSLLDENALRKVELENLLEGYRDDLRQLKADSGTVWDAIKAVDDKEGQIVITESENRDIDDERISLLDEKNDIFKKIRQLDLDIRNGKVLVKAQSFNTSDIKKAIGVNLSNNCITAVSNNMTTTCPTYEELYQLDSSRVEISGDFISDDNGYFHRDSSPFKNSWRWYDHDPKPRIFIDPPSGMAERIPMITIENNFGVYFLAGDHLLENGTRSYHEGRFIDNCRKATLDSVGWLDSLPDTIYLMRIGCPDTASLDTVYVHHNSTEINIAESNDWKYKAWMSDTKEKCKMICKEY